MNALTYDQLMERLAAASESAQAYIDAGPQWVQIWILVMTVVLAPSLLIAIFKREARWVAFGLVQTMIFTPIFIAVAGTSKAWGFTHIFAWTVPCIICILALPRVGTGSLYGKWLFAATLVMVVSLGFDFYDVYTFMTAAPAGAVEAVSDAVTKSAP